VPAQLTDTQIQALIEEPKPLPPNMAARLRPRPKRGHKERDLELTGATGSRFKLILRESLHDPLDFSVILAYRPRGSFIWLRIRRYNGKSHEHSNGIEHERFYDFHIHTATERYQAMDGVAADSFAAITDRYTNFQGALDCMLQDCRFETPPNPQLALFGDLDL
jgi:hypothetical protein